MAQAGSVSVNTPTQAPPVSHTYRRYVLALLFVSYTLNYLDRQVITILAEPLKTELGISDTQLGLLTGLAFGLVYCSLGLPIARLADRFNRIWILGASLTVWSACTILCGRAASFPALVAARVGVALGESGAGPVSMALISDYVPKEKRASALALFTMGAPVGGLLGLVFGGMIAGAFGWRAAFLIAGLPGLVLALIVLATLREPRNLLPAQMGIRPATDHPPLRLVFAHIRTSRTFWFMCLGAGFASLISYGQAPFLAAFFLRVHGAELAAFGAPYGLKPVGVVGIGIGLIWGVFGAISNWLGGFIADRYVARDLRIYGAAPAIAALLPIPFTVAAVLVPSPFVALLLLMPGYLCGGVWFGPVLSSVQGLVPPAMRATSGAVAILVINMIGLGFGALTIGKLSDIFNYSVGLGAAEGVRWALVVCAFFGLIPALLFWMSRSTIRAEMIS